MADTQQLHGIDEPLGPVPVPVPVPGPGPGPAPTPSGFGVAALTLGVVGLASAVTPIINFYTASIPLLGLILGLVALRITKRRRGFAIAGTVVSAVAVLLSTVFAVIVPIVLATNARAPLPGEVVQGVGPTASASDGQQGSIGTRENPVPIGTTVRVDSAAGTVDWEVTLGPPMLDADDVLAAYSESTDPAPEGFQYAMVPVTVLYLGTEAGTPWADLAFDFVAPAGTAHSSSDSFAVAPEPLTALNELESGESGTGNVVVAVPSADVENGMWVVSTMLGDQYFFEAQ